MTGLEAFIGWSIPVLGVILGLSLVVLIKKRDYGHAIRNGAAIVIAIISVEMSRSDPEPSGLFRKLSIIPLLIAISITYPVVRRAWDLLRGRSDAA
jgi:hypothetical protein